jgi:signal transduction histidine kinase
MKRLVYFIGIFVCVTVFSLYINNTFQVIIAQDVKTQLFNDEATAYRLKEQIVGSFSNAQQDARFLSSNIGETYLKENETTPLLNRELIISKTGRVLSNFLKHNNIYKAISYFDSYGNEVIHLEGSGFSNQLPIPNKSSIDYFKEGPKHKSDQTYASFDGASLYVCSALYNASGRFSGVLALTIQKNKLLNELQSFADKGNIILVEDTGKYILKPANIKRKNFLEDNPKELFSKILSSQSGNIEIGNGFLLTYVPLELDDHRWFLMIKTDKQEVADYSTTLQYRLTGLLFIVLLTIIILLFLWFRSFRKALVTKQMKIQNEELEALNANLINKQNELEEQNALVEELNSQLEDESIRYLHQKDTLQVIVDSVSSGIVMTNTEGKGTFANKGWKEIFKFKYEDSEEYIEPVDFLNDMMSYIKDDELVIPELTRLLKDFKEVRTMEIEQLKPSHRYLELYSAPCIGENNRVFGRIFVCRDISLEKEVDRLKSELISTVSHELRTPMSSILGFSELLLTRELKPERSKEYIGIIHNEAKRLTNLVKDFLDIQRMESGKQSFSNESVEIKSIIGDVSKLFQNIDETYRIVYNLNEAGSSIVKCDFDKIKQVMFNLISNAIKYSPKGGEISVNASVENDFIKIGVKDQGLGIPEEAKKKLFTKFFRVDNDDRRKIGGTGLGLAICKEIINAHGGNVWADSIHGQGSTFYFTLPLTKRDNIKTSQLSSRYIMGQIGINPFLLSKMMWL